MVGNRSTTHRASGAKLKGEAKLKGGEKLSEKVSAKLDGKPAVFVAPAGPLAVLAAQSRRLLALLPGSGLCLHRVLMTPVWQKLFHTLTLPGLALLKSYRDYLLPYEWLIDTGSTAGAERQSQARASTAAGRLNEHQAKNNRQYSFWQNCPVLPTNIELHLNSKWVSRLKNTPNLLAANRYDNFYRNFYIKTLSPGPGNKTAENNESKERRNLTLANTIQLNADCFRKNSLSKHYLLQKYLPQKGLWQKASADGETLKRRFFAGAGVSEKPAAGKFDVSSASEPVYSAEYDQRFDTALHSRYVQQTRYVQETIESLFIHSKQEKAQNQTQLKHLRDHLDQLAQRQNQALHQLERIAQTFTQSTKPAQQVPAPRLKPPSYYGRLK